MDERLKRRWSRWLLNSAIFSGESDGDRYMELKDDFLLSSWTSIVMHSNIFGMKRESSGMILKFKSSFT